MKDQVVLVTGASSGIGLVSSKYLSAFGYQVIPAVRKKSDLGQLPNSILLDVTWNQDRINKTIQSVFTRFGHIDVLINNAGFGHLGSIRDSEEGEFRDQLEVNLFGTYKMIKSVLPIMKKQKHGLIINISSILGLFSIPDFGLYSASKFAIEGLSQSLRLEEAGNNIKVVVVNPGSFKTKFYQNSIGKSSVDYDPEGFGEPPLAVAKLLRKIIETKHPKMSYLVGKEKLMVKGIISLPGFLRDRLMKKYYS